MAARSISQQKKAFCKSVEEGNTNVELLDSHVVFTTKSLQIPYCRPDLQKDFDPSYLDYKYQRWNVEWLNIEYTTSSYDDSTRDYYLKDGCDPSEDIEWFHRQLNYCKTLIKEETLTLRGYTTHADRVVNTWLLKEDWWSVLVKTVLKVDMKNVYFAFFYGVTIVSSVYPIRRLTTNQIALLEPIKMITKNSERYNYILSIKSQTCSDEWKDFWNQVIRYYYTILREIVLRSPKTSHCLTVWRGSKDPYWVKANNKQDILLRPFTSTSIDTQTIEHFREGPCCLIKLTIPEHIRCLFIAGFSSEPSEAEVLLCDNSIVAQDTTYGEDILQNRPYHIEPGVNAVSSLCRKEEKINISFLTYKQIDKRNLGFSLSFPLEELATA